MHYARPHWFPTEPKTILFMDELPQASIAVQNVCLQLILDRCVGPHRLPDDCVVIGVGNRPEDRAGANALTTALLSRFTTAITIEPDVDEWLQFAKQQNYNPLVVAWVESQLKTVLDFNPRDKGGFVCPAHAGICRSDCNGLR